MTSGEGEQWKILANKISEVLEGQRQRIDTLQGLLRDLESAIYRDGDIFLPEDLMARLRSILAEVEGVSE